MFTIKSKDGKERALEWQRLQWNVTHRRCWAVDGLVELIMQYIAHNL